MANSFHNRPDGFVRVATDAGQVYYDTRANFESDHAQSLPALQFSADEQIYEQGIRHTYAKNNNVVGGGPVPYAYGDAAISSISSLIAAQNARKPVPTPPPTLMEVGAVMKRSSFTPPPTG